ncbi:hypothetical protein JCM3774_004864 [Rhodotorula dairenensis]
MSVTGAVAAAASGSPPPSSADETTGERAAAAPTVAGSAYLEALAQYIKRHEAALASYNAPRRVAPNPPPPPSWTTVLTLGIVPTTTSGPEPTTRSTVRPRPRPNSKEPLVLRFDPHHLYYLLLKFDEIGLPSSGDLDVRVEGGTTRPMMVEHHSDGVTVPTTKSSNGGDDGASLFGSVFGGARRHDSDARSVRSGLSSFSFGSGWWGLGGSGRGNGRQHVADEAATVRYIYSSCTKLPALRLSPFELSDTTLTAPKSRPLLARVVEGFEDCPPPAACVPLGAFKNLSSLVLEDLDPRGFLGWDILSVQLRSLEIHRGGIEDIGELICDAPCEDLARRERPDERRNKPVGTERRRRAEGAMDSSLLLDPNVSGGREDAEGAPASRPATPSTATSTSPAGSAPPLYPTPPRLAWSSLRHLSLSDNALTFIPSAPLTFLGATLTSLDLSSNLLITIPPALAHLTRLRSLDLSDNMIDSLLGIAKALGAVEALNLSRNRIENLSGLDRLPALERLDLRENAVYDVLEVSRLARLPHLREVWLAGNPLTASHWDGDGRMGGGGGGGDDKWRVKCFGYFAEEQALGHRDVDAGELCIDGRIMTSSERRVVEAEYQSRQGRPLGLGLGRRKTSVDDLRVRTAATVRAANGTGEQHAKVVGRRVVTAPHRHSRAPSPPPPSLPTQLAATGTEDLSSAVTSAAGQRVGPRSSPVKAKRRKPQRIVDLDEPRSHRVAAALMDGDDEDEDEGVTTGPDRAEPTAATATAEGTPSPAGLTGSPGRAQQDDRSNRRRGGDRASAAASRYDHPPADSSSSEAGSGSGEAFRRRIEALRSEVGESWLSVLSEREAREERERKEREVAARRRAAVVREGKKEEEEEEDQQGASAVKDGHEDAKQAEPATRPPPTEAADTSVPADAPTPPDLPEIAAPISEQPTGTSSGLAEQPSPATHPDNSERTPSTVTASERSVAERTDEAGAETEEMPVAGSAVVPTTVKSVRKKRGKSKKKGGR